MSKFVILLGKAIRFMARLRGGGSALPGLITEKLDPTFMQRTLSQLPYGVAIISGTNGKTTTTKIVMELLRQQGLKVFTNSSGSNFTRGVVAALLAEIDLQGKLDADIAILELDEAHAVHFVNAIPPRYCLLLNVMRDQLDRFGEIDTTAKLLASIAHATTDVVVLNREDPYLRKLASELKQHNVYYFGLSPRVKQLFPNDNEMHAGVGKIVKLPAAEVLLEDFKDQHATFTLYGQRLDVTLRLSGVYNLYNAAAALALVTKINKNSTPKSLKQSLSDIEPAFGRGETVYVGGQPLELILVKNPGGFRLSLQSYKPENVATMIAINDEYADGRDMSWLWDVEFDSLREPGVSVVSGSRAYDMALRLQYDEIPLMLVEPHISTALEVLCHKYKDKPKRIYCTYTAMLTLRRKLSKITKMEHIT